MNTGRMAGIPVRLNHIRRVLLAAMSSGVVFATAAHAQAPADGADNTFVDVASFAAGGTLPTGKTPLLSYGADVGLGETDNVYLSSTNKVTQTIATADVDFVVNQPGRLLDVRAVGAFTDLSYLEGAFGNEFIGRFNGQVQYALIPERLTWVLRDDFGQATLDAFTAVTPNNLQQVNYVSTGPDLNLRLGGTGFLKASARYANAYYQTSPFDSNRLLATLGAGLQLSARSTVSLNGGAERVLFQNTAVNNDFDRYTAFARYEAQGARTSFGLNLGGTKIEQKGNATGVTTVTEPGTGGTTVTEPSTPVTVVAASAPHDTTTTEPLAKLELGRALSPAMRLSFTAGRELTDASSSLATGAAGSIGTITYAPSPLTSDVYTATYASGGWQYVRNRTTINVSGRWERDRYPGAPEFNLNSNSVQVSIQRRLTPAFSATVIGNYYKSDYLNVALDPVLGSPESDTKMIGALVAWRQGRWLQVSLRYDHTSYSVAQGAGGYGENRIFLLVGYRPKTTALQPGTAEAP
jgi:hypothetical protein